MSYVFYITIFIVIVSLIGKKHINPKNFNADDSDYCPFHDHDYSFFDDDDD